MRVVPIVVMILIARSVCGASAASSQELEPARSAVLATLESMLPEGIVLDACDMAIAPPKEDLARGILIAWNGAWTVRPLTKSPAIGEPSDGGAAKSAIADGAALTQRLAVVVEGRLPDGASIRDPVTGMSTRSVFLAIGQEVSHTRLLEALHACVAREVRAPRVWLVGRDLVGGLGVMPIHLPVDHGVDPSTIEADHVTWTLRHGGDSSNNQTMPDLFALGHAIRRANGERMVNLRVCFADSKVTMASVVAVVNECRRFGFGFLVSTEAGGADSSPCAAAQGAVVVCDPPMTNLADPPPRIPGKAIFGDPSLNGGFSTVRRER